MSFPCLSEIHKPYIYLFLEVSTQNQHSFYQIDFTKKTLTHYSILLIIVVSTSRFQYFHCPDQFIYCIYTLILLHIRNTIIKQNKDMVPFRYCEATPIRFSNGQLYRIMQNWELLTEHLFTSNGQQQEIRKNISLPF